MRTIVVEGIPGCGKTVLSKNIGQMLEFDLYPVNIISPDYLKLYNERSLDHEGLYLINWEIKDWFVQTNASDAVLDRNHLTTLAYNYSKSIGNDKPELLERVLGWYKSMTLSKKLHEPDIYVIIEVPFNICISRSVGKKDAGVWWVSSTRAIQLAEEFYSNFEELMRIPELNQFSKTKVIRISGMASVEETTNLAMEKIKEALNNN